MNQKMLTPNSGGGGSSTASNTLFDNTNAQLPNNPDNVQNAIEEVVSLVNIANYETIDLTPYFTSNYEVPSWGGHAKVLKFGRLALFDIKYVHPKTNIGASGIHVEKIFQNLPNNIAPLSDLSITFNDVNHTHFQTMYGVYEESSNTIGYTTDGGVISTEVYIGTSFLYITKE